MPRITDFVAAAERVHAAWGGVDVVINNAGVATAGDMDTASLSDWEWVLDINLWGPIHGCHVFTPILREAGYGGIINVASAAALLSVWAMLAAWSSSAVATRRTS